MRSNSNKTFNGIKALIQSSTILYKKIVNYIFEDTSLQDSSHDQRDDQIDYFVLNNPAQIKRSVIHAHDLHPLLNFILFLQK